MSLTLQRAQNRLAWKAKNRLLCSEDRLLSLQTICTMRINCRWPIHLFRPLWQKWKCYCDRLPAQSSLQVLGSNKNKMHHLLFDFLEVNLCKRSAIPSPLPTAMVSPHSSYLSHSTDVHQLNVTTLSTRLLAALTLHAAEQLQPVIQNMFYSDIHVAVKTT